MRRNGPVVGALVVLGLLAPGTGSTPPLPPTRSSCKPSVPLSVTLEPHGPGRWSLQCSSLDRNRDVTVWMWTGDESTRREVWRGRLEPGTARTLDFARRIAQLPTMAALLIKESVNQTQDNQGFHNALNACFTLHELNHSHWAQVHDDRFPVAKPEDGTPSWREAPPIVPAEKGTVRADA